MQSCSLRRSPESLLLWLRRPARQSRASRLRTVFRHLSRVTATCDECEIDDNYDLVTSVEEAPEPVRHQFDSDILSNYSICTSSSDDLYLAHELSKFSVSECYHFNCHCDCFHPLSDLLFSERCPKTFDQMTLDERKLLRRPPRLVPTFSLSQLPVSLMKYSSFNIPLSVSVECVLCQSKNCLHHRDLFDCTTSDIRHNCRCSGCDLLPPSSHSYPIRFSEIYGCRRFNYKGGDVPWYDTIGVYYGDQDVIDRCFGTSMLNLDLMDERDDDEVRRDVSPGTKEICPCHGQFFITSNSDVVRRARYSVWLYSRTTLHWCDLTALAIMDGGCASTACVYVATTDHLPTILYDLLSELKSFNSGWIDVLELVIQRLSPWRLD